MNLTKPIRLLQHIRSYQRLNLAMARAGASAPLRQLDPARPLTWEFCGFSQHGEDGIIDYLTRQLRQPNGYFIEIGCANGLENNSTWLALGRAYAGLMIDGNPANVDWARYLLLPLNYGLQFRSMFVTRENIAELKSEARHLDPDLFSLDIDGNDYHIAQALVAAGFRPRIWVVEYNSAFGPERSVTVPYNPSFKVSNQPGLDLYSGCSLEAWRRFMTKAGLQFVTVDSCGCNAVFIDPSHFPDGFAGRLEGSGFRDNRSHVRAYGGDWRTHYQPIAHLELLAV